MLKSEPRTGILVYYLVRAIFFKCPSKCKVNGIVTRNDPSLSLQLPSVQSHHLRNENFGLWDMSEQLHKKGHSCNIPVSLETTQPPKNGENSLSGAAVQGLQNQHPGEKYPSYFVANKAIHQPYSRVGGPRTILKQPARAPRSMQRERCLLSASDSSVLPVHDESAEATQKQWGNDINDWTAQHVTAPCPFC